MASSPQEVTPQDLIKIPCLLRGDSEEVVPFIAMLFGDSNVLEINAKVKICWFKLSGKNLLLFYIKGKIFLTVAPFSSVTDSSLPLTA